MHSHTKHVNQYQPQYSPILQNKIVKVANKTKELKENREKGISIVKMGKL